jgi:hypothetical protein
MEVTQDFHLAMDFANNSCVLEIVIGMKIFCMHEDPSLDGEGQVAVFAIHTKGGDAKEGRNLVRHIYRLMIDKRRGQRLIVTTTKTAVLLLPNGG